VKTKAQNDEVLYPLDPVVVVSRDDIQTLVDAAKRTARRRIRLCAHRGVDDPVHEMLIVHERGAYVRPHLHLGKEESFHVIDGDARVILFDDRGAINKVIDMGPYVSGRTFYYRLPASAYHTLLIRSDRLVVHEVTRGPFRREETVFAPWAPEEADASAVASFMNNLLRSVERA
jgi:cupin fold WbuC family metalloprotein